MGVKSGRLLHHAWILFPLGSSCQILLAWVNCSEPRFPAFRFQSSVSADSSPSWGWGTGTPQCPSSFSFPSYVFSFWRQELPWSAFVFLWHESLQGSVFWNLEAFLMLFWSSHGLTPSAENGHGIGGHTGGAGKEHQLIFLNIIPGYLFCADISTCI